MFQLIPSTILIHEYKEVHNELAIFRFLYEAKNYYPSFDSWYFQKVIPEARIGKREIISEVRDGKIVGVMILKNTSEEKKICSLRVSDEFQNHGLGVRMFEKAFKILETDKPFLTVSEEKLPSFQKIFTYFQFTQTERLENYYREGKKEFSFNGHLSLKESL